MGGQLSANNGFWIICSCELTELVARCLYVLASSWVLLDYAQLTARGLCAFVCLMSSNTDSVCVMYICPLMVNIYIHT